MARTKALGRDSHANVIKLVSELNTRVALPLGEALRDDSEWLMWDQFTRARAIDDWRDFDLVVVAKIVRLEADIRKHQITLDSEGPTMTNERGTVVVNPMLTVVDNLQRRQLALIRSINLSHTARDPRTLNGQGVEQTRLRNSLGDVCDLLAQ